MKKKSNLTLVIATRWRSKVFAQTIDSALNNAVFDNEIIIVADCPTWQTLKVIQERKLRHYTVYFSHCFISYNFGIWKAQSEYVSVSDDDQYFGPRWDEALMEIMKPNIVGTIRRYSKNDGFPCGWDGKDPKTFKPELLYKEIEKNKHHEPEWGCGQPVTFHRETFFKHYGYTFHCSQGHGHELQVLERMKKADPNFKALMTYKSGIFHYGSGGGYSDPGHYLPSSGFPYGLKLCLGCGKAERNTPNTENPNSAESHEIYRRGYYLCPDCLIAGRKDIGKFRLWDFWSRES